MSFSVCHCFSSSQSAYYFLNGQVQYMQNKGHTVSFALPDDGFIDDLKAMFPKADIHIIPIIREINVIQDLKALISYATLFKREKFDIIHLHTPKAGLLGAIAARFLMHKHIVFHLHGLVSLKWDKFIPNFTFFMEKIPLLLAHKVLCVSDSLKQLCVENELIKPKKISVLHNGSINGIDHSERFNPEKLEVELGTLKGKLDTQNKFVLGFLGRMNNDKGLVDIIEVANLLKNVIPNLLVVFVGPNEIEGNFDQFLEQKLNVPYQYLPRTSEPELYISLFDIMLFPSYREGFGLVIAEANALKVPVVSYNIAGVRDAVANNETAILVEAGNIKELVNAVTFYYNNPAIKVEHGLNGRKRVIRYFTPEDIWQAQLNFYEDFIS